MDGMDGWMHQRTLSVEGEEGGEVRPLEGSVIGWHRLRAIVEEVVRVVLQDDQVVLACQRIQLGGNNNSI